MERKVIEEATSLKKFIKDSRKIDVQPDYEAIAEYIPIVFGDEKLVLIFDPEYHEELTTAVKDCYAANISLPLGTAVGVSEGSSIIFDTSGEHIIAKIPSTHIGTITTRADGEYFIFASDEMLSRLQKAYPNCGKIFRQIIKLYNSLADIIVGFSIKGVYDSVINIEVAPNVSEIHGFNIADVKFGIFPTGNRELCSKSDLRVCDFCIKCAKVKYCAKCKVAKYCSGECQKFDWKHHKKVCK